MMRGATYNAIIRAGGRSSTGLRLLAWLSPSPLVTAEGPASRCKGLHVAKGNTRARKDETEMLILIGKKRTFRSPSGGHSLNGRSRR